MRCLENEKLKDQPSKEESNAIVELNKINSGNQALISILQGENYELKEELIAKSSNYEVEISDLKERLDLLEEEKCIHLQKIVDEKQGMYMHRKKIQKVAKKITKLLKIKKKRRLIKKIKNIKKYFINELKVKKEKVESKTSVEQIEIITID